MTAQEWVDCLSLAPHPEGGYYRETYRSTQLFDPEGFVGQRSYATSIYFLLEADQFSALHRIKSDEAWHFYDGDPLEIIEIDTLGNLTTTLLGKDVTAGQFLFYVVKAGNWFGSRPAAGSRFSLVGCTVAPGFDFADFEMPGRDFFLSSFPNLTGTIEDLTRNLAG